MRDTNFLSRDLFVFMFGVYGERFFVSLHSFITQMNPNYFAFIMMITVAVIIMTQSNK